MRIVHGALFALCLAACTPTPKVSESTISKAISTDSIITLDLNLLTTKSWEKAFVFGPYTPKNMITQVTGCPINFSSQIEVTEGYALVVLTKKHSVVCYADISRSHGEILNMNKRNSNEYYTPLNAIIVLKPLHIDDSTTTQKKSQE